MAIKSNLVTVSIVAIVISAINVLSEVPPPSETPAKIIVSGRTSTAVDIKIVKTGQEIPPLIRRTIGSVTNSPGFEWYVSEHYALKSDMPEDKSRQYLELLELTLPHWVWLLGGDEDFLEGKRMGYVYCKDGKSFEKQTWGCKAGGICWNGCALAHSWPCCYAEPWRRDLLIHESLHQGQMVLNNDHCGFPSGGEKPTYTFPSHVYDAAKKQLTVMVFDRASWGNMSKIESWQTNSKPFKTIMLDDSCVGAPFYFCLFSDPDRLMKWRLWRDLTTESRTDMPALYEKIFAPTDKLEADWKKWISERHKRTFSETGIEQDGNAIVASGTTHIQYTPAEKVTYDPFRMDYPAEPMPSTVGPVKRGVDEPSVGYEVDFSVSPYIWGQTDMYIHRLKDEVKIPVFTNAWGGFGLGVQTNGTLCQVVISKEKILVVDGKSFGIERKEFPLSQDVIETAQKDGHKYGVTIQIRKDKLEIDVRAGKASVLKEDKMSVPLTTEQRQRLMTEYMAIIGGDGPLRVTPYIDDARKMEPDLMKPAAPNIWRFDGEEDLYRLYHAEWILQDSAPASLKNLKQAMVTAMDKDPAAQQAAIDLYRKSIAQVLQDVQKIPDTTKASLALAAILRVSFSLELDSGKTTNDLLAVNVKVKAKGQNDVKGIVSFVADSLGKLPEERSVQVASGKSEKISFSWNVPTGKQETTEIIAKGVLTCQGVTMTLQDSKTVRPSIPCWWTIGPFDNKGASTVDTPQVIETEKIDLEKKYTGKGGKEITWKKSERSAQAKLTDEHVIDFVKLSGADANVSAYALTWVQSPKEMDAVLGIGSDDGVVVWLNDKKVFTNLVGRGYSSMQDRVPIHLKAGSNKLLVKVTQGGGGWAVGAQILDIQGKPADVSYEFKE